MVLLLAAMSFEAAPFRSRWPTPECVTVAVTGIGPQAAESGAAAWIERCRPAAVIGIGVCGALAQGAAVGDIAAPAELVSDGDGPGLAIDPPAGLHVSPAGRMVSVTTVAATPAAKRVLRARCDAQWVDQESYGWVKAARAAGVPCLVVRTVLDTADDSLPALRRVGSWPSAVRLPARALRARRRLAEIGRQVACELL